MEEHLKILIVDDDKRIVKMLEEYLKLYNFTPISTYNGREALAYLDESIALVILDINMDGLDGISVCEKIREHYDIPIIMLSANTTSLDKVKALGAGADDYIIKPFDPIELLARIKAHISRVNRYRQIQKPPEILSFGPIKIYKSSHKVTKNEKEINLSNTEFKLLVYFTEHPNIALDRKKILMDVWQSDLYDEGIINTYVKRIREKLNLGEKDYIKSLRGVGYIFTPDEN